jgi:hypothetical protein
MSENAWTRNAPSQKCVGVRDILRFYSCPRREQQALPVTGGRFVCRWVRGISARAKVES